MHTEVSIDIDAAPESVWAVMIDVERLPEWSPTMLSVEALDDGPARVGSRYRIRQPRLPVMVWTVRTIEPNHRFTWEAGARGVHTLAGHVVLARDGGSKVTLSLDQDGLAVKLLGGWISKTGRRYMEMEAAGLKRRAETGQRA